MALHATFLVSLESSLWIGVLLVVSDLLAVPVSVLWVGLENPKDDVCLGKRKKEKVVH
jgi:hypothetical protein